MNDITSVNSIPVLFLATSCLMTKQRLLLPEKCERERETIFLITTVKSYKYNKIN